MIKIIIDETGRNSLKDKPLFFNQTVQYVESVEEARAYLVERYGRLPKGRNKVYVDDSNGQSRTVGFTHSYWNDDISHVPVENWYQTDWVTFAHVSEELPADNFVREICHE